MRLPPPCNNVGGATEMGGIGTLGGAFGGTKVHRRMATLPDVAGVGCDRAQTPHHDEITTKCAKSRCATARHQPDGGAPVQEGERGWGSRWPGARDAGVPRMLWTPPASATLRRHAARGHVAPAAIGKL